MCTYMYNCISMFKYIYIYMCVCVLYTCVYVCVGRGAWVRGLGTPARKKNRN